MRERQHLLVEARNAGKLPEPQRRRSVLGLIHERYRTLILPGDRNEADPGNPAFKLVPPGPELACTEEDIFRAAYGDPEGRAYWAAWLDRPLPPKTLARVLATHLAAGELEFRVRQKDLLEALGTNLFAPSAPPIAPHAVIEEWLAHVDTRKLVPASLLRHLTGTAAIKLPAPVDAGVKGAAEPAAPAAPETPPRQASAERPGPRPENDEPLLDEMEQLIVAKKVRSVRAAGKQMAGRASGIGSEGSKADRLTGKYKRSSRRQPSN